MPGEIIASATAASIAELRREKDHCVTNEGPFRTLAKERCILCAFYRLPLGSELNENEPCDLPWAFFQHQARALRAGRQTTRARCSSPQELGRLRAFL